MRKVVRVIGPSRLAVETAVRTRSTPRLRNGTVTGVSVDRVQVVVAGQPVDASYLESCCPAVGDEVSLVEQDGSWLVVGRTVGPAGGQKSAGLVVLDAAIIDSGVSLGSSTGAEVAAAGYAVSFRHPVGHTVLLVAKLSWSSTVGTDWILVQVKEESTGTYVGQHVEQYNTNFFVKESLVLGVAKPELAGGAGLEDVRTYTVVFSRLNGTGTVSVSYNPDRPGCLVALDIGDSVIARLV